MSSSSDLIKDVFGVPTMLQNTDKREFICGMEYEIESILDHSVNYLNGHGIKVTQDNSLRNNGMEYITPPLTKKGQLDLLKLMKKNIKIGDEPFSDRTSVHVHVNVLNLTMAELREFLYLYILMEPMFFEMVGYDRKNSIYCVPLQNTYLPSCYGKSIVNIVGAWHKYTAFNLLPIKSIGTVEFRHLFGTWDEEVIEPWLSLLESMYNFIINNPDFKAIRYIQDKTVSSLIKTIVPFDVSHIINEDMFYNSKLDLKLSTI